MLGLVLLVIQGQRVERTPDERNYQLAGRVLLERQGLHTPPQRFQGPVILLGTQITDDHSRSVTGDDALRSARIGMLVFPMLLLTVLTFWVRQTLGEQPALAVAFLGATHPSLLAYGPLLSSDVAFTATGIAAAWAAHRWLLRRSTAAWALFGLLLGLHAGTKYTSAITGGSLVLATFAAAAGKSRSATQLVRAIAAVTGACLIALGTLYTAYLFASPPCPSSVVAAVQSDLLRAFTAAPLGSTLLGLLPEPLVLGLDYQLAISGMKGGSFAGTRGNHAAYYPLTVLAKTPLVLLLTIVPGAIAARRTAAGRSFWLLLLAPGLTLLAYCSATRSLQMGIRYVLPVAFAILPLAACAVLHPWAKTRIGRAMLAIAAISCLGNVVAHWTQPLGYFNALFGGSSGGWRWCADGNCEWDQRFSTGQQALRARHTPLEILRTGLGPRFGKVAVYTEDLISVDPRDPGRNYHWLERFEPIDHDGAAWLVFDVAAADFQEAAAGGDRRAVEDLALAWLHHGDLAAAQRVLASAGDEPALAAIRRITTAIAEAGEDRIRRDAAADLASASGHHELALALIDHKERKNAVKVYWLLVHTGCSLDAVAHLESITSDGTRTPEEVALIALRLVDGGKDRSGYYAPDPERALELLRRGPAPPTDSPDWPRWLAFEAHVQSAVERERRLAPYK